MIDPEDLIFLFSDCVDDDGNGYVDDIHGCNFLGGKDGRNVEHETLELTREYVRLKKKYANSNGANLSGDAKKEFEYWQGIKTAYEEQRAEAEDGKARIVQQIEKVVEGFLTVEKAIGKKEFSAEEIAKVDPGSNADLKQALQLVQAVFTPAEGTGCEPERRGLDGHR